MAGEFITAGVSIPPGSLRARRVSEEESPNAFVNGPGDGGVLGARTVAAVSINAAGRPNQRSRPSGLRKIRSQ